MPLACAASLFFAGPYGVRQLSPKTASLNKFCLERQNRTLVASLQAAKDYTKLFRPGRKNSVKILPCQGTFKYYSLLQKRKTAFFRPCNKKMHTKYLRRFGALKYYFLLQKRKTAFFYPRNKKYTLNICAFWRV